jgi:hypothetical protein
VDIETLMGVQIVKDTRCLRGARLRMDHSAADHNLSS